MMTQSGGGEGRGLERVQLGTYVYLALALPLQVPVAKRLHRLKAERAGIMDRAEARATSLMSLSLFPVCVRDSFPWVRSSMYVLCTSVFRGPGASDCTYILDCGFSIAWVPTGGVF